MKKTDIYIYIYIYIYIGPLSSKALIEVVEAERHRICATLIAGDRSFYRPRLATPQDTRFDDASGGRFVTCFMICIFET